MIKALHRHAKAVTIVLTLLAAGLFLPGGMNGRQMADAARVHRPNLQVLFITGYAENAIVGHGHLAPGMAVMTKPFAIENMAARIRSMIEAKRVATANDTPPAGTRQTSPTGDV